MIIAFWCVFISGLMPIVWTFVAKLGPGSDFKSYNNNAPRMYLSKVTGMAQRANWAQQNSWEAFAPFAAAVIIAYLVGVSVKIIDSLALIFVFSRTAYGIAYICDRPNLRSIFWIIGFGAMIGLYICSIYT